MLAGALVVSAVNGSPYETLKNAAFDALFYENVTIEGEFTLRIDGQVQETGWIKTQIGNYGSLTMEGGDEGLFSTSGLLSYTSQEHTLNSSVVTDDGTQWYSIRRVREHDRHLGYSPGYEMFGAAGRNSNYARLAEVLIDLAVGNLKNNFTISSQGDMRRVSGAITESQLPELVRVLIDLALEESYNWNSNRTHEDFGDNVLDIPVRSLTIDRVAINADIDNDGNLRFVNGVGQVTIENMLGNTHVIEGEINVSFSEIGTTVPESPIAGISEIFTADLFESLTGSSTRVLYFALDEDGNIDIDSIGSQWPLGRNLDADTLSSIRTSIR